MSKSDPIVIVNMKDAEGNWQKVGNTEWLKDTHDPKFATKIEMEYSFEVRQHMQFLVMDVDDPENIEGGTMIGKLECTMGQIAGGRGCKLTKPLVGEKDGDYGVITVIAEQTKGRSTDTFKAVMGGSEILNKDGLFGKSDPFLKFFRKRADGELEEVPGGETNKLSDTETPVWDPIAMNMMELCNGDLDATIVIEAWDYDAMSGSDQIGVLTTTLRAVLSKEKLEMKDYKEGRDLKPGFLFMVSGGIERKPNFLDYVGAGCELTVSFAIDFTMSNKDPSEEGSLHFKGEEPNQYEQAMTAVGEILVNYDHDKKFALYGYGGIPPGKEEADHAFALTMDETDPEVEGVEGMLTCYAEAITAVKLYGPTNFADVIKQSHMIAKEQKKQHYHILLIITDGDITDRTETIDAIITSASSPMSIVIVGVGDESFEDMKMLDADGGDLKDGDGNPPPRDIVQFVPFKECVGVEGGLAVKVLEEVPRQLLQFMCVNTKQPGSWSEGDNQFFILPEGRWAW